MKSAWRYSLASLALLAALAPIYWLMTISLGHFLIALFTNLNAKFVHAQGAAEFYFYAVLMFLATGAFIFCATRYRERRMEPN